MSFAYTLRFQCELGGATADMEPSPKVPSLNDDLRTARAWALEAVALVRSAPDAPAGATDDEIADLILERLRARSS